MSEEWKIYLFNSDYMISTDGRVKSLKYNKERILKPTLSKSGYLYIILCDNGKTKTCMIHHLVLETHIGPRPAGCICNHKDGIKANNNASNLEWSTYSENNQHAYDMGLRHPLLRQGEKNGNAKLTTKDVLEIRRLYSNGYKGTKLAKMYAVSDANISGIINQKYWKHV